VKALVEHPKSQPESQPEASETPAETPAEALVPEAPETDG